MTRIDRSTNIRAALKRRQRGFLLDPYRHTAASDPFRANCELLLHCDGADGSTTFTDSSPNAYTVTANGNAQIDTAQSYYGGASALFDGTGDYLSLATAADWKFLHVANAQWTLHCLYRATDHGNAHTLLSTSNGSTANVGIYLAVNTARNINFQMYYGSVGNYIVNGTFGNTLPTAGTWCYITLTWDHTLANNNAKCWINGTSQSNLSKTANAPSAADPTRALLIGTFDTTNDPMKGHLDELRIYNTITETADHSVPAAATPDA